MNAAYPSRQRHVMAVDHGDFMTGRSQKAHELEADVAIAASHQYAH
jgi:hypothetical protein